MPHEFVNKTPCLSIAWNCSPPDYSPSSDAGGDVNASPHTAVTTLKRLVYAEALLWKMREPPHNWSGPVRFLPPSLLPLSGVAAQG